MVQPHPEPRLRDELFERAGPGEPLGPDALDAEILHHAFGTKRARAKYLAHAATPERAPKRVASEPLSPPRWERASRGRFAWLVAQHVVAVCLALDPSGQARADERPKLVIVREGEPLVDAPLGLARELADQLTARGLVVRDAPGPVAVEEPNESAALEDASRAYTALHPAEARQLLDALFAHADAVGTAGLDEASFARALFLLALAAQATGDEVAADAALDRLLVVYPAIDADPATYPPPLLERLTQRRALVTVLPPVVLRVATVPGASVEVDGRALAAGSTEVHVVPGPHLVRARAPTYVPAGQRVEVRADPTDLALPLALDPGTVLAVPGPPTDVPADALVSVARTLDATLLLVDVTRVPTGFAVDVRDLSSSRRTHLIVPRTLTAHALAVRIAAALLAPPHTAPVRPPPHGPAVWPWLVAAGAVVAGAVVLGVALSVNTQPSGFVLVPETP